MSSYHRQLDHKEPCDLCVYEKELFLWFLWRNNLPHLTHTEIFSLQWEDHLNTTVYIWGGRGRCVDKLLLEKSVVVQTALKVILKLNNVTPVVV